MKAKASASGQRKAARKAKARKPKAVRAKAIRPRKARVSKAGPARQKAPAPMVWDVLPEPKPTLELEAAVAPIPASKRKRAAGPILLAGLVVLALAALGIATQVTSEPNTGTIKVRDGPTADPPARTEPHVSGDLFIEGSTMAADSGGLFFFSWPPTGDGELVLETTWEADDGEPAFHFLAGPFELPCGHYRVGASNGPAEPEDFPGGMKKKGFWVECPDEGPGPEPEPPCGEEGAPPCPPPCGADDTPPCPPPCGTDDTPPCPAPCGTDDTPPCPAPEPAPEMECPSGLLAIANGDGSVQLAWTEAPGSDGTNVYRADGDGDFEYVTTTVAGVESHLDTTTVAGESYTYLVTGLFGNEESEGCMVVETTAIPDLPTVLGAGLALGGSLLAFALLGRRRKA